MSCPTLPFSFRQGKRSAQGQCHSRIARTQEQMSFTFELFICSSCKFTHLSYIEGMFKKKRDNILT